jgi:hypothetical protein
VTFLHADYFQHSRESIQLAAQSMTLTLAAKITGNANARGWFEHGLAWMYGYNFEEAIGCYMKAAAVSSQPHHSNTRHTSPPISLP